MIVDLDDATGRFSIADATIQKWCFTVLMEHALTNVELSIRIVDNDEGRFLNHNYRQKDYPTNVLSFPAKIKLPGVPVILGDIAICLPVIQAESITQKKSLEQHCAHMIVHGILHLLGFDHVSDSEAKKMEAEEIGILEKLGYPNPYLT